MGGMLGLEVNGEGVTCPEDLPKDPKSLRWG